MAEPLLTAQEVAQNLKLNVDTVYALIAHEALPASKVGGQWRFHEADVDAWLEERKNVPKEERAKDEDSDLQEGN